MYKTLTVIFNVYFTSGDITLEDVYRAVPWPSTIDVINVSGSTLWSIMEHSVKDYDPDNQDPGGKFLQISGLIVHYNITKPIQQRVISIKVGQPVLSSTVSSKSNNLPTLVDDKVYSVALPSYLIGGGDGYKMIPRNLIDHKNTGFLMQDLVTQFVKNNSPISLPVSGRIIFVSNKPSKETFSITSGQVKQEMANTLHFYILDIALFLTCLALS